MFFGRIRRLNKKNISSNLRGLAKRSDVPFNLIKEPTHYEINSNREITVEGCRGILQYEENIVRLNMQNMITVFCGRKLAIKCLTEDSLIITGFVTSVEFVT